MHSDLCSYLHAVRVSAQRRGIAGGIPIAGRKHMAKRFLDRVTAVASGLLQSQQVEVTAKGEDYYTVEVREADDRKSNFPPIWLSGSLSDKEIRDKLSREFIQHVHPESSPDDASVPNLKTEGRQHQRAK